jgi:peptidoglycan/xylan/chitin deacetylase (PgdA/CDA1 family)
MATRGIVYLMYHELEVPGRPLCQAEKGYVRYVLSEGSFREQLQSLKSKGFTGLSVGQTLRGPTGDSPAVAITFDDGCETDLIVATPLLEEVGFSATFYLTAGLLGQRGYLSRVQAAALSGLGFEIGCHSMTHRFLTDLGPGELRTEIVEAKSNLEQIIGRAVEHFSCPGGRWNRRIAEVAQKAGYRSVATSCSGRNSPATDPFRLARLAVLRGTPLAQFNRWCSGQGIFLRQCRELCLAVTKSALGNSGYERLRGVFLGSRNS